MVRKITMTSLQYWWGSYGTVCKLPQHPISVAIKVNGSDINVNIIDFVTFISWKREIGIGKRGLEADDSSDDSRPR